MVTQPASGDLSADGLPHSAQDSSFTYILRHDESADAYRQPDWRFCGKCAGAVYNGEGAGGVCPKTAEAHYR
jgi:hypothetical protein